MICRDGSQLLDEVRKHLTNVDTVMLAWKVGLHPTTIRSICNGKTRWPRETTLFCVIHTLKLQIKLERSNL